MSSPNSTSTAADASISPKPERLSWLSQEQRKTLATFISASMAACGAVTFTNPFEVVKTRLQLQGELSSAAAKGAAPRTYNNVFQAFWVIGRNEGIRAVQKGLGAGYIYQIMLNGTRVGFYEPTKKAVNSLFYGSSNKGEAKEHMALNVVAGGFTGMLGAAAGSPFFLVKTRMQSYSTYAAVGHQHYYPTFIHGLASIYRRHGFRGLYRSMDAAMIRAGSGSAVQLASYDKCKELIMKNFEGFGPNNFKTHLSASMVTGLLVCTAMNPFDVISTRMYNQRVGADGRHGSLYRNPIECLMRTVSTEGITSLYKGFFPHYLRIG
ncbi:Mitochondrial oxaloacetate carrier protein [Mycoemilia scoparia]|uniref:Mitochondrial oxaloacetate carrier protein n=1 Tax=Mycoemilia scoparia TaxID=417184 RepID=A0A9W8DVS3_9FUNG|nr:Mitochondrial oxaloacetate carrier protein [Mycoemilia scoparia]